MGNAVCIGSHIRLKNTALAAYLDTCGRVMDESALPKQGGATLVQTSTSADRDHGSGTWEVVSANGVAHGSPVNNNMQLHLRNLYSGAGYVAIVGAVTDADAKSLDDLVSSGWGNSDRYVQTIADLGDKAATIGPASFALAVDPAPADHANRDIVDGDQVQLRCYVDNQNFYLSALGPLAKFATLRKSYPSSQNGLVFAEPNVPIRDAMKWTVSIVA